MKFAAITDKHLSGAKQKAKDARNLNLPQAHETGRNFQKTIYHSVEAAPRNQQHNKSNNSVLPNVQQNLDRIRIQQHLSDHKAVQHFANQTLSARFMPNASSTLSKYQTLDPNLSTNPSQYLQQL